MKVQTSSVNLVPLQTFVNNVFNTLTSFEISKQRRNRSLGKIQKKTLFLLFLRLETIKQACVANGSFIIFKVFPSSFHWLQGK